MPATRFIQTSPLYPQRGMWTFGEKLEVVAMHRTYRTANTKYLLQATMPNAWVRYIGLYQWYCQSV